MDIFFIFYFTVAFIFIVLCSIRISKDPDIIIFDKKRDTMILAVCIFCVCIMWLPSLIYYELYENK